MALILVKSYVGLNETSKIEFDSTVLAANRRALSTGQGVIAFTPNNFA